MCAADTPGAVPNPQLQELNLFLVLLVALQPNISSADAEVPGGLGLAGTEPHWHTALLTLCVLLPAGNRFWPPKLRQRRMV